MVTVAALALSPTAALALPPQGGLTQLAPPNDCIQSFAGGCGVTTAKGFNFLWDLAVSPDGKNVYVASSGSDAIAIFKRNSRTGNLIQRKGTAGCIAAKGASG
ncbi:MAG: beta-propeller fold lactonase family protein, partial [Solirubrobacterales bacterium]